MMASGWSGISVTRGIITKLTAVSVALGVVTECPCEQDPKITFDLDEGNLILCKVWRSAGTSCHIEVCLGESDLSCVIHYSTIHDYRTRSSK